MEDLSQDHIASSEMEGDILDQGVERLNGAVYSRLDDDPFGFFNAHHDAAADESRAKHLHNSRPTRYISCCPIGPI